jgi:hypothetical protein
VVETTNQKERFRWLKSIDENLKINLKISETCL